MHLTAWQCVVISAVMAHVTGFTSQRINPDGVGDGNAPNASRGAEGLENFLSNNYGHPRWEVTSPLDVERAPSAGDGNSTQLGGERVLRLSATWTITQNQLDNITKTFHLNQQALGGQLPTSHDTPTQTPLDKPRRVSYNTLLKQLYGPPKPPAPELPLEEDYDEDDQEYTTLTPKGHNISQHILDMVFSNKPLLLPVVTTPQRTSIVPQDQAGVDVGHTGANNGTDDRFAAAATMIKLHVTSGTTHVKPSEHPPLLSVDHSADTLQPRQSPVPPTFIKADPYQASEPCQPSRNSAYEHVPTVFILSVALCIFSNHVI